MWLCITTKNNTLLVINFQKHKAPWRSCSKPCKPLKNGMSNEPILIFSGWFKYLEKFQEVVYACIKRMLPHKTCMYKQRYTQLYNICMHLCFLKWCTEMQERSTWCTLLLDCNCYLTLDHQNSAEHLLNNYISLKSFH